MWSKVHLSRRSCSKTSGGFVAKNKPALVFLGILFAVLFIGVIAGLKNAPKREVTQSTPVKQTPVDPDERIIGKKPYQSEWDSEVFCVRRYLRENLNDYDSSEFMEWSKVGKIEMAGYKILGHSLKLRAKNAFGAYIIKDTSYLIRNDTVILAMGLND